MTGYEIFREVAQWISVMVMLGAALYAAIATYGLRKEWDEASDRYDQELGHVHKRLDAHGAPGPVPARADTEILHVNVITDLDTPTPEQQAAPTRPDLSRTRPTPHPRNPGTEPIAIVGTPDAEIPSTGRHHRADA